MPSLHAGSSVRRLMGVVALVAVAFWVDDLVRVAGRAAEYRRQASHFERQERRCREVGAMPIEDVFDDAYVYRRHPELSRLMIGYFAELKAKYRRAAASPRMPVAADPPPPHFVP